MTQDRDQMLHDLKNNLVPAQNQMKKYADQFRPPISLGVGDWVYLKLQPYRLRSLAKKGNMKLSPRFYGPYQISKQIGAIAFELALPLEKELKLQVTPAAVQDVCNAPSGISVVLILWKDLPNFEATWEPIETIMEKFPSFHLEDKNIVISGGAFGSYAEDVLGEF
ncbi:uncharacterized protein [Cicer arietinum]|uniref:uncharacterized protein n=1 Tax=Cicer arietinum TaxID=3827 RepID=UPI003CC6429E